MATENIPSRLHCVAEGNVLAGANEILDDDKGKKQNVINQENDQRIETLEAAVGTGGSVDSRIESAKTEIVGGASSDCNTLGKAEALISTNANDIAALQEAYAALTQNDVVVVAPSDTWPVATPEQNTIYRVVDRTNTPPQYYTDYMWNSTAMVEMAQYNNAIDARPKKASQNLVTSGGVFDNMGALDVSELNATENPHTLAKYVDLSAALAAVPTDYQKGGMSIKFVQSSDNKYVQYRYMGTATTGSPNPFLDTANWQGVDDEPTAGSDNLVKSGGVAEKLSAVEEVPLTGGSPTINYQGNVFSNEDYDATEFSLKSGDVIYWSANASTYIAALSIKNDNNTYSVQQIGKIDSEPWDSIKNYYFLALNDCTVNLTYHKTRVHSCIKTHYFDVENYQLWKSVKPIAQEVDVSVKNAGYLPYPNGTTISSADTYYYTKVDLKAGDKLFWIAKIVSFGSALFTDGPNGTFKPLIGGKGWENYEFYSYLATADCSVYIGYINNTYASIIKGFGDGLEKSKYLFNREPTVQIVKYGYFNRTSNSFNSSSSFVSYLYKVETGKEYRIRSINKFNYSNISLAAFYADENMETLIKAVNIDSASFDVIIGSLSGYMLVHNSCYVTEEGNNNIINCIGDSLTEGQDGLNNPIDDVVQTYNSYTDELKEYLPNHLIMNYGYGGNTPSSILVSCGLSEMVINTDWVLSQTLAIITDQNQSEITDEFIGGAFNGKYLTQGHSVEAKLARSAGYVHGYRAKIEKGSGTNNTIRIYSSANINIPIKSGDVLQTDGMRHKDAINILFIGRNDLTWFNNTEQAVKDFQDIISTLPNDKYLIIGQYTANASEVSGIMQTNNALRKAFGNRFIDLQQFLCSDTPFNVLNYTKTTDSDISAERQSAGVYSDQYGIDNNLLPSSFWRYSKTAAYNAIDNVHLDKIGYKAIAYCIQEKINYFKW